MERETSLVEVERREITLEYVECKLAEIPEKIRKDIIATPEEILACLPKYVSPLCVCVDYDGTEACTSNTAMQSFRLSIKEQFPSLEQEEIDECLRNSTGTTESYLVKLLIEASGGDADVENIRQETSELADKRIKNHPNPNPDEELGYHRMLQSKLGDNFIFEEGFLGPELRVSGNVGRVGYHRSGQCDVPWIGGELALSRRALLEIAKIAADKIIYCGDSSLIY